MAEQRLLRKKQKALIEENTSLLLSACTDLAEIYISQGRYKDAIDEYKETAQVYKVKGNEIDFARVNRGMGDAYLALCNFEAAFKHLHIYLDIAKKEKDQIEEQRALANLGHAYLTRYLSQSEMPEKSYLNSAYKFFMKSLSVCESLTSIGKFERSDMSARIFSNLGLVHESLGNFEKGVELFTKSINICKANDIYDQLQRSYTSLASLYEKIGDYNEAIQNYNLAYHSAKFLKDKVPLMCASLASRAEVLIKLGDFTAAKFSLYKAYKLKMPNLEDRASIERNLRIVTAICRTQKELLSTSDTNYKRLKELYEKMGDGACELKNYSKAIECYHKMLKAAEKCGGIDCSIATCYFSLAETYRDNGQYAEAIEYYRKEYKMCKDLKDSLNTLIKIADCTESKGATSDEVKSVYEMGIKRCRDVGDAKEEGRLLSRYIVYLRKHSINDAAFKMEQRCNELGYISSDTESEEFETQNSTNIGDDVSLSNITDMSDTSDVEEVEPKRTARKRTKMFVVKRNKKGETPLHTACIAGNMNMVKQLLEQGHPVNVRDNCGWLPLHEACICGHLEIVQLLLDKGASINDRGGIHCRGVTPLHDAATNGHLHVIELLINRGASLIAKTDDGETAIPLLMKWRESVDLQSDEEAFYQRVLKTLTRAVEKIGQRDDTSHIQTNISPPNILRHRSHSNVRSQASVSSPKKQLARRDSRRSIIDDDICGLEETLSSKRNRSGSSISHNYSESESDTANNDSDQELDAAHEYRQIMNELRHKPKIDKQVKRDSDGNKKSAFVDNNDPDDDWLINDLPQSKSNKRRKTSGTPEKLSLSRNNSMEKESPRSNNSWTRDSMNSTPIFMESSPPKQAQSPNIIDLVGESLNTGRQKPSGSQISLLQAGFSRVSSKSPLQSSNSNMSISKPPKKHQTKLTNFGHVRSFVDIDFITTSPLARHNSSDTENIPSNSQSSSTMEKNIMSVEPTLSVDVRIEGKLYRVPILMSQMHTRTIKWLAEEAAQRYAKRALMKPILELETKNGAVLADEDLVSLLFTAGSTYAEEVEARVVEWQIPSFSERYKEACTQTKTDTLPFLIEKLEKALIALDLTNETLHGTLLLPMFKALNRQSSLLELKLSGNFLSVENIRLLGSALPTLKSLQSLDISCSGLSQQHMQCLADTVSSMDNPPPSLRHLDISYNPVGNAGLKHLEVLLNQLTLHSLNLAFLDFTSEVYSLPCNQNVKLKMQSLEEFNLSANHLGTMATRKFLSFLDYGKLKSLNISRTMSGTGVLKELVEFFEKSKSVSPSMSKLNVSKCSIQDSDVFDLLKNLTHCLEDLNLSHNKEISGITLRRVLSHPSLQCVNLSVCHNILKYFENLPMSCFSKRLTALEVFVDEQKYPIETELLQDWWRKLHENAVIKSMRFHLSLHVNS